MKKVAFIAEGFPRTGFGNYWHSLFDKFMEIEKVYPVYIKYNRELDVINGINNWQQIRVIPAGMPVFYKFFNRKINRLYSQLCGGYPAKLKLREYDILHFYSGILQFFNPNYKHQKVIVTCHDLFSFMQARESRYDRELSFQDNMIRIFKNNVIKNLHKADAVIAVSKNTKKDIENTFNIPSKDIFVVYNGVNSDLFKPRDKYRCRKILNFPQEKFIILNVGTETQRKNVITLLKALKLLKDCGIDFLLVRVGKQSKIVKEYIETNDLQKNITYYRYVDNIEYFYNAADIYVSPSLYEGFGLVLLESLSSGCPVVTTKNGAIPEVVGDEAVLISNPFEENELCDAIKTLYFSSDDRDKLSQKGRQRAERFSWKKCLNETLKIYSTIS